MVAILRNGLQPLLGDKREQFERGAARVFLTALPLADEPSCDVEVASKHSLACLLAHTDLPDLLGRQFIDRRQAHFVERLHRPLIHDARLGETERSLVHGRQNGGSRPAPGQSAAGQYNPDSTAIALLRSPRQYRNYIRVYEIIAFE